MVVGLGLLAIKRPLENDHVILFGPCHSHVCDFRLPLAPHFTQLGPSLLTVLPA